MSNANRRDIVPFSAEGGVPLEALLPRRKIVAVIGIDDYAWLPKLRCAVRDALGFQELLVSRFGFEAPLPPLTDRAATKPAIEALVEDQLRRMLRTDDALILFFAGHGTTRVAALDGVTVETGYIAPVEARGADQYSDLLNMEELLRKVGMLPARHILVVLDACYSGMALGSAMSRHRGLGEYMHALLANRSRRVITSARRHEPALDDGPVPGHSLFTGTLIQGLISGAADLDKNGVVTFSELALFLQQRVGQASGSRQTPDHGSFHLDDRGELVIAVSERALGLMAPAPRAPPAEALAARSAQRAPPLGPSLREAVPDPAPLREPARRMLARAYGFAAIGLVGVFAVWFMYFQYDVDLWLALLATANVVGWTVGFRPLRSMARTSAMRTALAWEAEQQARSDAPAQRAEVFDRYRRIVDGLDAQAAFQRRRGRLAGEVLDALRWVVLLGTPGAGKTTALQRSGLLFPQLDPDGRGLRGIGGAGHSAWWISTDGILIEWTCEPGSHDAERGPLRVLSRIAAVRKPSVDSVLLVVSVAELLDGSAAEIGRALRATVDEMQRALQTSLPVDVLFTKCDLIAGFAEQFGDLPKRERARAWGATLPPYAAHDDPAKLFEQEFELLLDRLRRGLVRRLPEARDPQVRERIFQFPLELAEAKLRCSELITVVTASSRGEPAPRLRGFYLSSAVQEGTPVDRRAGALRRAVGLSASAPGAPAKAVEPRSYFLRDAFDRILAPEEHRLERSPSAIRGRRARRIGVASLGAVMITVPAVISYRNNRALVAETARVSREAAEIRWDGEGHVVSALDKLDRLKSHVVLLEQYVDDPPGSHAWPMFQGDKLFKPMLDQYVASLKAGFVVPVKAQLESKLGGVREREFLDGYNALRSYLLLGDQSREHLEEDAKWQTGQLTQAWTDVLKPSTDLPEFQLRARLMPHVAYYVDRKWYKTIAGEGLNEPLIEQARGDLLRVDPARRYYDQLVTSLIDEKYDEAGPSTRENLKYPPVSLDVVFEDRPEVLTVIDSAQRTRPGVRSGVWLEVQGPYTAKGYAQVLESMKQGRRKLENELWVLPLSTDESRQGDEIRKVIARVQQDYYTTYVKQWEAFFRDVKVNVPSSREEAIHVYKVLSTPDWPYRRLLQRLSDETQFPRDGEPGALTVDGGLVDQAKSTLQRKVDLRTGTRPYGREIHDPVPGRFKSMIDFGVPAAAAGGQPAPEPKLAQYVRLLVQLSTEIAAQQDRFRAPGYRGSPISEKELAAEDAKLRASAEEALKQTRALLLTMDSTGQNLLEPLLINPLRQLIYFGQ